MKERNNRKIYIRTGGVSMFVFWLAFLVFSCEKYSYDPPTLDPNEEISFQEDILPFFANNCTGCHNGAIPPDLTAGNAYEEIQDGYLSSDLENNPEESGIYSKLLESGHVARASDLERQMLLNWIRQGAKNN